MQLLNVLLTSFHIRLFLINYIYFLIKNIQIHGNKTFLFVKMMLYLQKRYSDNLIQSR